MRRALLAAVAVLALAAASFAALRYRKTAERRRAQAALDLVDLRFSDEKVDLMLPQLRAQRESLQKLRERPLPNEVPPALVFSPWPRGFQFPPAGASWVVGAPHGAPEAPADLEELAFKSVAELSALLRARRVTSVQLAEMYLKRLRRLDPQLHAVVAFLDQRALQEAAQADAEIAAGKWRGPLHGIPYGAKDLLAAKGAPTTWGSVAYHDQVFDNDAAAISKLQKAGAVLVAKLALGELAWGDVWFGGTTKNPWKLERGSSGSSAGPASAVAAGALPFAIGSETLGSIMSPSAECGVTGLRPTFGRVSRAGAMALAWSMDKLGPLCRQAEDCAAVLDALAGRDDADAATIEAPVRFRTRKELQNVRIGVWQELFDKERPEKAADLAALKQLEALGAKLERFEPPPIDRGPLRVLLDSEAAAAFDELTRSGRDDLLVRQIENAWPNVFRRARLIPAVEYIQANRWRERLIEIMAVKMKGLDALAAPTRSDVIALTGYTGHPAVAVPDGFTAEGLPASLTLVGQLLREGELLELAQAFQDSTDWNKRRPPVH